MPVNRQPKDQPAAEAQHLDAEYAAAAPEGFNPEEEDGSRQQQGDENKESDPKLETLRKRILEERIDFLKEIEKYPTYPIINLVETTKKYEYLEAVYRGGLLPPRKLNKQFSIFPQLTGFRLRWNYGSDGKVIDWTSGNFYSAALDDKNHYVRFKLIPGTEYSFGSKKWVATPEQADQFNSVGYISEPVLTYKNKEGKQISLSLYEHPYGAPPEYIENDMIEKAIRREFEGRTNKAGKPITPFFKGKSGVFFSISDEQIKALSEIRPVTLRKNEDGQSMYATVIYDPYKGKIVPCFQTYEQYKAKKQEAENKQQREASRQPGTAAQEHSATQAAASASKSHGK